LLLVILSLSGAAAQTLRVLTHDSFAISQQVIDTFTRETGITVEFLPAGDAGETVNRAILTSGNPIADLLYGIDNSLLARARDAGIFEPYHSPLLEQVDPQYLFDPQGLVTPIDVGFVNFNLDLSYFRERDLPEPGDIAQLTDPSYRGLVVVENPATSSPGLAFMLATIDRFGLEGEGDWLDYWAALRDNGLLVTDGWSNAYYTAFSRYGGDRPIVLSYATSPAAEVIFASEPLEEAPTGNLFCSRCAYRQIEAVGILAGTRQRRAAEAFIDFMLKKDFQEDIPLNMFVYPVTLDIPLPEAFTAFAQLPEAEQTAELPSELIEAQQQRWLEQWTEVVIQGREPAEVR